MPKPKAPKRPKRPSPPTAPTYHISLTREHSHRWRGNGVSAAKLRDRIDVEIQDVAETKRKP